jgi:hypothetical protein
LEIKKKCENEKEPLDENQTECHNFTNRIRSLLFKIKAIPPFVMPFIVVPGFAMQIISSLSVYFKALLHPAVRAAYGQKWA